MSISAVDWNKFDPLGTRRARRRNIMKIMKGIVVASVASVATLLAAPAMAQATASLHGQVTNPAGMAQNAGTVELTKDKTLPRKDEKMQYTFQIKPDGSYSGTGIAPGDYLVYFRDQGKDLDRLEVTLAAGDNKTLNDDMTREEYMKTLTPEQRKQIEEYKKNAGAAIAENKVIANLNNTLKAVRADLHTATPNYDKDVADMKAATAAKPDAGVLWITYGDALTASADHQAAADRSQGKPLSSDDATMKLYTDAADAYKKGADLDAASKKPNPADQAIAYNQMGSALAKQGKVDDAKAAYEKAASLQPASAGMYYGNEAAVLYNASQQNSALAPAALEAADKAIAADPNRPDPYYIKGQVLLQKATVDPKTQKVVAPPGTVEAYQKYLELAPQGKEAPSVEQILQSMGEKIATHYRAGRKK